jgi:uncharacterized protein YjbJ (UPF0337 family)
MARSCVPGTPPVWACRRRPARVSTARGSAEVTVEVSEAMLDGPAPPSGPQARPFVDAATGPRRLWVEQVCTDEEKEQIMGDGNVDDMKGKVKKAGGDLTGDKGLKREGKVDEATGTVKDKVGDAGDKVKDVVNKD